MKNQFFGDIRDYRKYGLLRILSGGKEDSSAICWMLTPDVGGPDGKHINYLRQCEKWRQFDKDLFDALHQAVIVDEERNVTRAEVPEILDPKVFSFYKEPLTDNVRHRREYFREFLSFAVGRDLVFFDPDNGLEVKRKPRGRKGSSRFLYLDELSAAFEAAHSIVIFQFYLFKKPEDVIKERTNQILSRLEVEEIASFHTDNVVFFLIPQAKHLNALNERTAKVRKAWVGQIQACWHFRTGQVSGVQRHHPE
jgi:hypothetical protein